MKAVLHTGAAPAWAAALGDVPWALLPVGNRPFLEYWLEWCLDLGIRDVRIVLGRGAECVESYAGDGARWGLTLSYSFLKEGQEPDAFLRRSPEEWVGGLFYLRQPVFPLRLAGSGPGGAPAAGTRVGRAGGSVAAFLSREPDAIRAFIAGGAPDGAPFSDLNVEPAALDSVGDYFELNMRLVGPEAARYVRAGYSLKDEVSIGYNAVIPSSVTVNPPAAIGNHCRVGELCSVGPSAVVGNHVIVDRQTELSRCVILDGTYIGRGLEITGKIVSGRRLIDPASGAVADIPDPWLVSAARPMVRAADVLRALAGWAGAAVLAACQALPFLVLYPAVRLAGQGRFRRVSVHLTRGRSGGLAEFRPAGEGGLARLFQALGLDLFPRLLRVLAGDLWLCGMRPVAVAAGPDPRAEWAGYFPAVLTYDMDEPGIPEPGATRAHALYYLRFRSLAGDLRLVGSLLAERPLRQLGRPAPSGG